jgi:hypothetical protein
MAKKTRTKKKEKKNIQNGIVHIQSTFNNTMIRSETSLHGRVPACRDSKDPARAHRLQLRWRRRTQPKKRWNTA